MEQRNSEPETSQEAQEGSSSKPGIGERFRESIRSAGESVTGTADTITGVQFRRQFEDFTDAVTTAVVGVHRDQGELRERLEELEAAGKSDDTSQQLAALQERQDKLESADKSGGPSALVIVFGIVSVLALMLSIIAVVRTF